MLALVSCRASNLLKVSDPTSRQLLSRYVTTSYLASRGLHSRGRFRPDTSVTTSTSQSLAPNPMQGNLRRMYSNKQGDSGSPESSAPSPSPEASTTSKASQTSEQDDASKHLQSYPRFLRRLATTLPNPPHLHRPTRDDFLNVASSMWDRLRIRFKWLTIRGFRKFNADDLSAFFSWFLVGQTLWIFVGTTTFVSVIFAIANSLRMQESIARLLSDYLTAETGIQIVFESAIVPKWKDSRICFENVFISRRPGNRRRKSTGDKEGHTEAARLLSAGDPAYHHQDHGPEEQSNDVTRSYELEDPPSDVTYFDINIDNVYVTLSLWRWWNGKGILTDAEVKGVRGVIDRRHLPVHSTSSIDPASTRYVARAGDFQLESMRLEDVLLTIYQPDFRPYTASIFSADLARFRKQWVFYDLMSAENMVGQFDNCLFSVHRPQSIDRTMGGDIKDATWRRMSRFRIDGVNVDHMQYLTERDGPIAWITSGKVDAVLDIRFGRDPAEEPDIQALLGEIAANLSAVAKGSPGPDAGFIESREGGSALSQPQSPERIPGQRALARPALSAPTAESEHAQEPNDVVIDIDFRFRDLKAAVPLFTRDLSYTKNALIRPIVAFINANRTLVPIHCRIVKRINEFDGSWTIWQTGLSDDVAEKTYEALAHHVGNANHRRLTTVSLWSLRVTAGAISAALKNIVDSQSPKRHELA